MTRIDFYILDDNTDAARFRIAARIAEKAHGRAQHVYINAETPAECTRLDETLWTYSQSSFLPHRVIESPPDELLPEPVLIGNNVEVGVEPWQVLINLADQVPEFFSRYERVAEIIDANGDRRAHGRARYKYYRDRGYELSTHKV